MVSSYVDNGVILVSTGNKEKTKQQIIECFEDCKKVATARGMDFSVKKLDWMGIGKGDWGTLEIKGEKLKTVKEIRILGYRIDTDRKWKGHMEYWTERGIGIRRNISGVGRRYGSEGGIGAWECLRLIKSTYMPTVYYGLEFMTKETSLVKRLQIMINDTIRLILGAPIQYANKILYAETGLKHIEIRCRAEERKGCARHRKYEYGKEYWWFGCIADKGKDDRIRKHKIESEKVRITKPRFDIEKDKNKEITDHSNGWENKPEHELWVYTDGLKNKEEAAIAWVLMGGEDLVEEENGRRVPGEWNITKSEICAIGIALRDMKKLGKKKIRVFSDSMSGIIMMKEMRSKGESASLWDTMTDIFNEWEQVRITWVPGHVRIEGKQIADKIAKGMRNRTLEAEGRWKKVDYEENSSSLIEEWKREEWLKWHEENSHEYYERTPKKPKHLKGLSRLDCYVLMRIRSGTDKKGHEECRNAEFRHHLAMCDRYEKNRPERHTLYEDKHINDWKKWWETNEYLNMGIPTNTESHDDVRIMYGNPFDHTITIEKNGRIVTENVTKGPCEKCQTVYKGRCQAKMTIGRGRWFFVDGKDMECTQCGGKFGGGSTSSPGGSGLLRHLSRSSKNCGRLWEIEYCEETIRKWETWDEEFKVGLVNKWIELYRTKDKDCMICERVYTDEKGVKAHVRKEIGCYKGMVKVVMEFPLGIGG